MTDTFYHWIEHLQIYVINNKIYITCNILRKSCWGCDLILLCLLLLLLLLLLLMQRRLQLLRTLLRSNRARSSLWLLWSIFWWWIKATLFVLIIATRSNPSPRLFFIVVKYCWTAWYKCVIFLPLCLTLKFMISVLLQLI